MPTASPASDQTLRVKNPAEPAQIAEILPVPRSTRIGGPPETVQKQKRAVSRQKMMFLSCLLSFLLANCSRGLIFLMLPSPSGIGLPDAVGQVQALPALKILQILQESTRCFF